MSRILTVVRSGVSVTAAVVLLSACGGSGDEPKSAGSRSGSSGSSADSKFCTQAASIEDTVGSTLEDQDDPASLPTALKKAADQIRDIEPPDEIATDWNALAKGVEQIADAFGELDFNDPNALAKLQAQVGPLQTQLESASTHVETYLRQECGIDVDDDTESAAPTK